MSSYAVTEVMSFIIVVVIAISSISFILFWGMPYMDEKKVSVRVDSALTQFDTINDVIQEVAVKGINGSSMVDFVTDAGEVNLDLDGERFIFYYSLIDGFDFNVTGLEDGNKQFDFIDPGGWADHVDIYYLENGSDDPGLSIPVISSYPLVDSIQIDVKNSSDDLIGRIWLFDSGSISYEVASSSGKYIVRTENGGVVSKHGSSGYIAHEPNINKKSGSLVLWMVQLKPGDVRGGSGMDRYTFLVKSNASDIRENKACIYEGFKMQIYGDCNGSWIDYFKTWHDFTGEDTLFLSGDRDFTLVHMVCEVFLMV